MHLRDAFLDRLSDFRHGNRASSLAHAALKYRKVAAPAGSTINHVATLSLYVDAEDYEEKR